MKNGVCFHEKSTNLGSSGYIRSCLVCNLDSSYQMNLVKTIFDSLSQRYIIYKIFCTGVLI